MTKNPYRSSSEHSTDSQAPLSVPSYLYRNLVLVFTAGLIAMFEIFADRVYQALETGESYQLGDAYQHSYTINWPPVIVLLLVFFGIPNVECYLARRSLKCRMKEKSRSTADNTDMAGTDELYS